MSLAQINLEIKAYFLKLIKDTYPESDILDFPINQPPEPKFGDLALACAFGLAKTLRKPPPVIAKELALQASFPGVKECRAEGAYINIYLDRAAALRAFYSGALEAKAGRDTKIIVEHTNINPNKAAHIGHLRNAVLGDTLVKMLRTQSDQVEVHNYIDDTGVQVADVVVGFEHLEKKSLADIKKIDSKFDYYCWDLYAKVGQFYAADKTREKVRQDTLLLIEHGGNPTAELAEYIANRIVRTHLETMLRLGISYDILPRESSIIKAKFWLKAFEQLKEKGAIYQASEGKNKDCWVMRSFDKSTSDIAEEQEKVIVRSNGTVTYVGKDIAYQLWKTGLLGKDFEYKRFYTYPNGHELWESTHESGEPGAPHFGGASKVFNVIDNRQSYLQKIVKQGLQSLGHISAAENSVHFSYEMVALTPQCAKELGLELSSEDQQRSFVEMSGRKGLGVKADDLLDRLFERCEGEVKNRNPELSPTQISQISKIIGVGALRYFMLKHGEQHVLSFDFDQALAFEGETGPYLQNALVRAQSILRKLREQKQEFLPHAKDYLAHLDVITAHFDDSIWEFLLALLRIEEVITDSTEKLQLSSMAKYAFSLAQRFHNFYHHNPIAQEKDMSVKQMRLFVTVFFIERMQFLLGIMGIDVPEKM